MRDYSKIRPTFWQRGTGKKLRGDADAQRVALYLMTCPNVHMTGLYYLPMPTLLHEVGIPLEGASKALRRLSEEGFAYYDDESELVFLPNGAREQIGERLSAKDNNVKAIEKHLRQYANHRFYSMFLELYRDCYHLESLPPPKPLRRGSEAPPDPLRSQEQEQEQEQEDDYVVLGDDVGPPAPEPKRDPDRVDGQRVAMAFNAAAQSACAGGVSPKAYAAYRDTYDRLAPLCRALGSQWQAFIAWWWRPGGWAEQNRNVAKPTSLERGWDASVAEWRGEPVRRDPGEGSSPQPGYFD